MLLLGMFVAGIGNASAQPIQLHPANPHYFLFRGAPTLLITSAEHYGAVLNLDFDYHTYLDALHKDGLNYTRIFAGSYVENERSFGIEHNPLAPGAGRLIVPWARSEAPGYVHGGNKFDLTQWDPAYFERLTDFIMEAGRRDIIVEVTLFSSTYTDDYWRYSPLHPENNINDVDAIDRKQVHTPANGNLMGYQEAMVRKIVRELRDFDNVFYEIQNEPWADQPMPALDINPRDPDSAERWYRRAELATEASLAWQKAIASFVVDEERDFDHRHLIAQNYSNFKYPVADVDSAVGIMNFHYAFPEAVTWNYGYDRVIGFDESGFAGNADTPYRKQAWAFLLAGGGLFNNLDYSFVTGYEDGTFANTTSPGGGSAALRAQLKVLKDFLYGFDFIRMTPQTRVVRLAPNAIPQVLADIGRAYALYFDGVLSGDLVVELPTGTYEATWVNTRTGAVEKREAFFHDGRYRALQPPSYPDDIALRIMRVEE